MKVCSNCNTTKSLLEFRNDCTRKDGKYPYCKDCYRKKGYSKKYKQSEKGKAAIKRYQQKNKGTINAKTAKRRAKKLRATPSWLNKKHLSEIRMFYKTCPKGYEVDHIIPLQGNSVCGLHVPWNLQILSIIDNRSKGNKLKENINGRRRL